MNTPASQNFLNSLPLVAGILGNKLGVTVELGSCCCTNGQVIELPLNLDERAVTREELLGFLVHEASHVRYTDFSVGSPQPLLQELINAIEDARIEKLIIGQYAGAQYLLNRCHAPLQDSLVKNIDQVNPASVYATYALLASENTYNSQFAASKDAVRAKAVQLFGQELMAKTDALLADFPKLRSTSDVKVLAQKLLDLLKQAAKSKPLLRPEQQPADSQQPDSMGCHKRSSEKRSGDNSDSQRRPAQGRGKENPDSTSETDAFGNESESTSSYKENSQSSDDGNSPDGSGSNGFAENAQNAYSSKANEIHRPDLSKQLREKIGRHAAPVSADLATRVSADFKCPDVRIDRHKASENGQKLLEQAYADSVAARRTLLGAVQAKARTGCYNADRGRRISLSRMSRLTIGSSKVFERREEVRSVDTAVSILLDLSGSVGCKSELAIRACLAMLIALRSISFVKSTMNVFPCAAGGNFNVNNGDYFKVVPFDDKVEKHVDLIGSLASFGGTPLAEAILGAAAELSQRSERKKIIFVITDGRACMREIHIVKKLRHPDCTLVGIFIDTAVDESVKRHFDVYRSLTGFGDLQSALMSICQSLILKGLC